VPDIDFLLFVKETRTTLFERFATNASIQSLAWGKQEHPTRSDTDFYVMQGNIVQGMVRFQECMGFRLNGAPLCLITLRHTNSGAMAHLLTLDTTEEDTTHRIT